jgi:nicotinamidase-related amidase
MQIFHPVALVDPDGAHPAPYTLVSAEDVDEGRWRLNPAFAESVGFSEEQGQSHLRHYVRSLAESGKYELTIWPYHALLGGIGHALVSAVGEAVFFHGIARETRPRIEVKGANPLTEHYSVLGPEVTEDAEGRQLADFNHPLVEHLLSFDAVVVGGQAKSHCVAWTIADLLEHGLRLDAALAQRLFLLEDCTSPVVVPGAIDYTDEADAAFRRFAADGVSLVRSTDSTSNWLPER